MVLLEGTHVTFPPANGTSLSYSGMATIDPCMAGAFVTAFMSIMTTASHGSHGCQDLLPLRCLRLPKGFVEGYSRR
jgi:hypothetical protein